MNVQKRLGRFKQWAGERMGGETKTDVSDEFKSLEVEMSLRHEGMKENQKAMNSYVKALSKRSEGDDRDKQLAVGAMGQAMYRHGEEFESDSEFGQCLIAMGRTNERVSRIQDSFVAQATSTWLESMDRSLAQMKEYQNSRKKLESRRLAYETALAKMEKAKNQDFRAEEETRAQKAKWEESSDDVYRRMLDIREAEADSVMDLGEFMDAQLNYYQRCYEALAQLKRDWPAGEGEPNRRINRSRSNTAHSIAARRYDGSDEELAASPPPQPARPAQRAVSNYTSPPSHHDSSAYDYENSRPSFNRATTISSQNPTRDLPAAAGVGGMQPLGRVTSDSLSIRTQKAQLRCVSKLRTDVVDDQPSDASTYYSNSTSSPDRFFGERSVSPATSYGSGPSRNVSSGNLSAVSGKKPPPPPPPSRAKKPPPPPPPMRRAVSTGMPYA